MKIIVSPRRSVRSTSRLRICAWIETSSALTASSAISSSGRGARRARSRRAGAGRRSARAGSGGRRPAARPTRSSSSATLALGASSRAARPCTRSGSRDRRADGQPRVQRGVRVLEDDLDPAPQRPAAPCRRATPSVGAVEDDRALVGLGEAREAAGERRLAAAGLADDPERRGSAASESETSSTAVSRGRSVRVEPARERSPQRRSASTRPVDLEQRSSRAHAAIPRRTGRR